MIAFIPATAHTTLAAGARTTPFPARGNGQSLLPHTIHGGPAPQLCLTPGPSPAPRRPLTSAGQKALDPPPALHLCFTSSKSLPSLGLFPHLQSEVTRLPGLSLSDLQSYDLFVLKSTALLFFFYFQLPYPQNVFETRATSLETCS